MKIAHLSVTSFGFVTLPANCTHQRRSKRRKENLMRSSSALLLIIVLLSSAACAKRSRSAAGLSSSSTAQSLPSTSARINVNTASAKELESLPGIGKGLAERIVEHRQKYGPFTRPEYLIMVRGISEHRFNAMRKLITVE